MLCCGIISVIKLIIYDCDNLSEMESSFAPRLPLSLLFFFGNNMKPSNAEQILMMSSNLCDFMRKSMWPPTVGAARLYSS